MFFHSSSLISIFFIKYSFVLALDICYFILVEETDIMTEREQIKAERKEYFKTAPFSKRVEFIWEYYRVYILIGLFLTVLVGYYIYEVATAKDSVLDGIFLNLHSAESENKIADYGNDFLDLLEVDDDKYKTSFTTTYSLSGDIGVDYEAHQAISVTVGAGSVDFMVAPRDYIMNYVYQGFFEDLRTILSEEQIKEYEPYFLYIDNTVTKKLEEISYDGGSLSDLNVPELTKPEDMKYPIPVLIDMSKCAKITNLYDIEKDSLVYGVLANAPSKENAVIFLDYLMK